MKGMEGVTSASVALTTETCRVELDVKKLKGKSVETMLKEVVETIDDAGFDARLVRSAGTGAEEERGIEMVSTTNAEERATGVETSARGWIMMTTTRMPSVVRQKWCSPYMV